ncbi:dihydroneopterin aldolase [Anaeroselena agilis]|uniref:7,8-dihydroneopterin aldolase n=1 Tax=Anaeroselena agilis TaxID=3063788 RepID=A0ABU3NWS5_9FIRM|nr:dihydroneopterin aldolase [Selenomonadales bacterium 4137-cl]
MGKITLQNMMFYGYHGVYEHEREMGQRFAVDAELTMDLTKAGETDELADSLDYVGAYEDIRAVVENNKFKLLEALAAKLAEVLVKGPVTAATVRVRKPGVTLPGHLDFVQVEVTQGRQP